MWRWSVEDTLTFKEYVAYVNEGGVVSWFKKCSWRLAVMSWTLVNGIVKTLLLKTDLEFNSENRTPEHLESIRLFPNKLDCCLVERVQDCPVPKAAPHSLILMCRGIFPMIQSCGVIKVVRGGVYPGA